VRKIELRFSNALARQLNGLWEEQPMHTIANTMRCNILDLGRWRTAVLIL